MFSVRNALKNSLLLRCDALILFDIAIKIMLGSWYSWMVTTCTYRTNIIIDSAQKSDLLHVVGNNCNIMPRMICDTKQCDNYWKLVARIKRDLQQLDNTHSLRIRMFVSPKEYYCTEFLLQTLLNYEHFQMNESKIAQVASSSCKR